MRRAPARPVLACVCDSDALFQRSHLNLHTSHCTLHTSHFKLTLRTPHFISSHLIWTLLTPSQLFSSHCISSHMSVYFSFHLSTAQPFPSHRSSSQLISAPLHVRKFLLSEKSLLHTKAVARTQFLHTEAWDADAFTQKSFYTQQVFTQRSFYTEKLLHTEASTHSKLLHTARFYTQQTFEHSKLLRRAAFTQRSL